MKVKKILSLSIILWLMTVSQIVLSDSIAYMGTIESVDIGQLDGKKNVKILNVSGKEYYLQKGDFQVSYKSSWVNDVFLKKGMKVKIWTINNNSRKVSKIQIISDHQILIN